MRGKELNITSISNMIENYRKYGKVIYQVVIKCPITLANLLVL